MSLFECVGDVFEEDESEDYVLVFDGVHVAAHLVGGSPELLFEAEVGAVAGFAFLRLLAFGHVVTPRYFETER